MDNMHNETPNFIGTVISPSSSHECYVETGGSSGDLRIGTFLVTQQGYLLRIIRAENISDAHERMRIAFRTNLGLESRSSSSPLFFSKAYLCEVLGKITENGLENIGAPRPGEKVSDGISGAEKFLSPENAIEIGTIWPSGNPLKISRHILSLPYGIFGDPGTGKTYATQKLGEIYVENRVPLIIFEQSIDREYSFWAEQIKQEIPFINIKIIKPQDFPVPLYLLSPEDFFNLVPQLTKDQADLLDIAYFELRQSGNPFNFDDLLDKVTKVGESRGQKAVAGRLNAKLKIFLNYKFIDCNDKTGLKVPDLADITIFDISDHFYSEMYASIIFTILRKLREKEKIKPFVLFIDEAHRLLGNEVDFHIRGKIRYFVRLARHLKIVPVFISQSPHSIDPQVFDILRSYFLFSLSGDNLRAISRISNIHPGLLENMPTLETGVCLLTSNREYLPFPIFLKFHKKRTEHLAENPDIFVAISKL